MRPAADSLSVFRPLASGLVSRDAGAVEAAVAALEERHREQVSVVCSSVGGMLLERELIDLGRRDEFLSLRGRTQGLASRSIYVELQQGIESGEYGSDTSFVFRPGVKTRPAAPLGRLMPVVVTSWRDWAALRQAVPSRAPLWLFTVIFACSVDLERRGVLGPHSALDEWSKECV